MNGLFLILGWTKKAMKDHHSQTIISTKLVVFTCLLMVATTSFLTNAIPVPATGAVQSFTFGAQNARYIQVQGTVLRPIPAESNFYRMQFAEVEVY
ncbi:MAG: hypothetical protein H0V70_16365 [Ktedonobacteraceae bacterium]|nr:hypothetical protein [Ktedonobacteraceae bacterium]